MGWRIYSQDLEVEVKVTSEETYEARFIYHNNDHLTTQLLMMANIHTNGDVEYRYAERACPT